MMSDVAKKLAVSGKAVAQILDTETKLVSGSVTQDDMNNAMRDMSKLADIAAFSAEEAIGILKRMRVQVERFVLEAEKELRGEVETLEVEDAAD